MHRTDVDEPRLHELIVESQDLHTGAMREAQAVLPDLAELHHEHREQEFDLEQIGRFQWNRRRLIRNLGLGGLAARGLIAGGFATAVSSLLARPVAADQNLDVMILQTASSLEILAVATYGAALQLPFISGGNPVVKTFATMTMGQHDQHRQAFQAQTQQFGGKVQDKPNPKYAPVVEQMKPSLTTPQAVVALASTLEQVATETYLADLAMFSDTKSRSLMGSVMGVECQHLATLRAVGALLDANMPELIAIPTDPAKLPAAAGSVAFPEPFEGTTKASPPDEGAVKS